MLDLCPSALPVYPVCAWGSSWQGTLLRVPPAPSATLNLLCPPSQMTRPRGTKGDWAAGDGLGESWGREAARLAHRIPPPRLLRVSRPSAQPLLPGTWQRGHAAGVALATPGCPATSPRRVSRGRGRPIRAPARKRVSLGQSPPPSLLPPSPAASSSELITVIAVGEFPDARGLGLGAGQTPRG